MLDALFPEDVATAWGDPDAEAEALLPPEEALVAGAVTKRRREFAKGRECARKALAGLGVPRCAVLSGPRREPLWPQSVVGSITHTKGWCAAAVGRADAYAGIGIDAEPDEPLARRVAERACSPRELDRLERSSYLEPLVAARAVFSVKESLFKLQFPITRMELGFAGVTVELSPDGTFDVEFVTRAGRFEPGSRLTGRWLRERGLLVTGLWLAA